MTGLALAVLTCAAAPGETLESEERASVQERSDRFRVVVTTDRADGLYACDERALFTATVSRAGKPVAGGELAFRVAPQCAEGVLAESKVPLINGTAVIAATRGTPGFVYCDAVYTGDGKRASARVGAGFNVFEIVAGTQQPEDFDAFWQKAREERDSIPVDARLMVLSNRCTSKADVFKISVANVNNTRIYGYLCVPKGRPGPLPALVHVPGAGPGLWEPSPDLRSLAERGALTLLVNVHPYDIPPFDGEPTELKKAYEGKYSRRGAPDPKKFFFYGAILGIDRSLNYLASRADWDRKHLVMTGISQGGGCALAMAGLNSNVTAVAAAIPGLCDQAGYKVGHHPSWPDVIPKAVRNTGTGAEKEYLDFVGYFDAVNFASRIRCPTIVAVGLIDYNPGADLAAFNRIKAPKRVFTGPGVDHAETREYVAFSKRWIDGQLGFADPMAPEAGPDGLRESVSGPGLGPVIQKTRGRSVPVVEQVFMARALR